MGGCLLYLRVCLLVTYCLSGLVVVIVVWVSMLVRFADLYFNVYLLLRLVDFVWIL